MRTNKIKFRVNNSKMLLYFIISHILLCSNLCYADNSEIETLCLNGVTSNLNYFKIDCNPPVSYGFCQQLGIPTHPQYKIIFNKEVTDSLLYYIDRLYISKIEPVYSMVSKVRYTTCEDSGSNLSKSSLHISYRLSDKIKIEAPESLVWHKLDTVALNRYYTDSIRLSPCFVEMVNYIGKLTKLTIEKGGLTECDTFPCYPPDSTQIKGVIIEFKNKYLKWSGKRGMFFYNRLDIIPTIYLSEEESSKLYDYIKLFYLDKFSIYKEPENKVNIESSLPLEISLLYDRAYFYDRGRSYGMSPDPQENSQTYTPEFCDFYKFIQSIIRKYGTPQIETI